MFAGTVARKMQPWHHQLVFGGRGKGKSCYLLTNPSREDSLSNPQCAHFVWEGWGDLSFGALSAADEKCPFTCRDCKSLVICNALVPTVRRFRILRDQKYYLGCVPHNIRSVFDLIPTPVFWGDLILFYFL